jgi:3-hydroxyacyl-CoA dehydrogenase/enoyl-CoA hydratase/3-hydroxybutyryl-CoA epimerase
MAIKKRVYTELEAACPENTIFASNTSALSVSEMGAATKRPRKMIGMHFFNPAHVMKLVEVVPGLDTAQETVDDVVMFTESLRKLPVVVQECPGFLVNRLLMPYLNEATLALQEGAATAGQIDSAMRDFGWPMGPFQLMDMLGIDVCNDVGQYLYSEYGERMAGAELFARLAEAKRFGEKTGGGFYDYPGSGESPAVQALIQAVQSEGKAQKGTSFSWERLMMPLVNEAVYCITEHVAAVNDIDMATIAGIGMTYKGERMGPLQFADVMGLDVALAKLEELQAQYGERFRPARLLKAKVRAGHLGKKVGKGFMEYTT